jgi:hypothetical protein
MQNGPDSRVTDEQSGSMETKISADQDEMKDINDKCHSRQDKRWPDSV